MNHGELIVAIVREYGEHVSAGGNIGGSFLATVTDVDMRNYSCSVQIVGSEGVMENVRLKSEYKKAYGIAIIPKKGSCVVVSDLGAAAGVFVSLFSEIEKMEVIIDGFQCIVENDKIIVKNGHYSLKKAFDDLIDAISRLTVTTGVGPSGTPVNIAEFQAIQQKLTQLIS